MKRLDRRQESRLLSHKELSDIESRTGDAHANYSDSELRASGNTVAADRLLLVAHLRAMRERS